MTPKQFVDKKLGEKAYTHSQYSMYREEIYDWLKEYADLNKSSIIDGIISESGKGKPSRLGNVEAIETDEGMIVVESKRTAVCDKINMKCNNIQTACSVCYTDYLHYKSKAD